MTHDLRARIAKALGWTQAEVGQFSLPALHAMVRPVDPKLASDMEKVISGREHWTSQARKPLRGRATGTAGHFDPTSERTAMLLRKVEREPGIRFSLLAEDSYVLAKAVDELIALKFLSKEKEDVHYLAGSKLHLAKKGRDFLRDRRAALKKLSGRSTGHHPMLGSPIKRINPAYMWLVVDPAGSVWAGNEYQSDAKDALADMKMIVPAGTKVVARRTYESMKKRGFSAGKSAGKSASKGRIYATTFCNRGHYVATGKPVGHECITIPPAALKAEMDGDYEKAGEIMSKRKRGPFGMAAGRAGHAAGYKGHDFKVGDIVKHKAKFLQSIGWYTNVPKNGKVTAVNGDFITVDWNEYDAPNRIHAANIMHGKKPDYSGFARGSKKAAKKPLKKAAKKSGKKQQICRTACRTVKGRFKACR